MVKAIYASIKKISLLGTKFMCTHLLLAFLPSAAEFTKGTYQDDGHGYLVQTAIIYFWSNSQVLRIDQL